MPHMEDTGQGQLLQSSEQGGLNPGQVIRSNLLKDPLQTLKNPECMNMQIFFHFINLTIRQDVSYFTTYYVRQRLWTRMFVKLVMSQKTCCW